MIYLLMFSATLKPEQLVYLVVGGATPELTLEYRSKSGVDSLAPYQTSTLASSTSAKTHLASSGHDAIPCLVYTSAQHWQPTSLSVDMAISTLPGNPKLKE